MWHQTHCSSSNKLRWHSHFDILSNTKKVPILNVSLFQAITVKIIKLIAALLTVINPHGHRVDDIDVTRCGAFSSPSLYFIWQIGDFLFQLEGRLSKRRQQIPSFHIQPMASSLAMQWVIHGFMHCVIGSAVSPAILCPSLDGRAPPLVIEAVQEPLSLMTLAPEKLDECSLELFAGARVDHGVDAAVKVAQPKDHLKYCFRRLQCREEGT